MAAAKKKRKSNDTVGDPVDQLLQMWNKGTLKKEVKKSIGRHANGIKKYGLPYLGIPKPW